MGAYDIAERLRCSDCEELLSPEMFYPCRGTPRGYQYKCKPCTARDRAHRYASAPPRTIPASKVCKGCRTDRPSADFQRHKGTSDGLLGTCKTCRAAQNRETHMRRKYGLSLTEFNELVERQGGKCAVCGDTPPAFDIDHCHETGQVRALLCHLCNVMLGMARDDESRLRSAADYLARHSESGRLEARL